MLRTAATHHMGLGFGLGRVGTAGGTSVSMLSGTAVGASADRVCVLVVRPVLRRLATAFLAFLAAAASTRI